MKSLSNIKKSIKLKTIIRKLLTRRPVKKSNYFYVAKYRAQQRALLEKWWLSLVEPTRQEQAFYASWPRVGPRMRILGYHQPVAIINWEFSPPTPSRIVSCTWSKKELEETIAYLDGMH